MDESPVKVYHNQTSLDVKPYNCLICGRRSGDETLRKPGEKKKVFIPLLLPWIYTDRLPNCFQFRNKKVARRRRQSKMASKMLLNVHQFNKSEIFMFEGT